MQQVMPTHIPKEWAQHWPLDWYVYDEAGVRGPMTAKETFALASQTLAGIERQVTRKGFTQWYPLGELAALYRSAELWEDRLARAIDPRASEAATEKKVDPIALDPHVNLDPLTARLPGSMTRENREGTEPAVINKDLEAHDFLIEGRLRLGQRQSSAFVILMTLLTLGLYWFHWAQALSQDLAWHVWGKHEHSHRAKAWWGIVPFGFFVTHDRLAWMLQLAEQDHGPNIDTSRSVTALLSFFPPFAMIYLTVAANRHWRAHLR